VIRLRTGTWTVTWNTRMDGKEKKATMMTIIIIIIIMYEETRKYDK